MFTIRFIFLVSFLFVVAPALAWEETLMPAEIGNFPPPSPFRAVFEFGWSELPAGNAEVSFTVNSGRYVVEGYGETIGLVRRLWKLNATNWSEGSLENYQPSFVWQMEQYAKHSIELKEIFGLGWVERQRQRWPSDEIAKWKRYKAPTLRDLVGTMLFIRSQDLYDGQQIRVVCFPGDELYLVHVKVEEHEQLYINGSTTPTIRLSLSLQKIGRKGSEKGRLLPYTKFQSARIWISDDTDRIAVRAEADVFVGYVYGEMKEFQMRDAERGVRK